MKLFIIILHYGDLSVTQKCVRNILQTEKDIGKIVVVNNDGKIMLEAKHFTRTDKVNTINNRKVVYDVSRGVNLISGRTHHLEVPQVVDRTPRQTTYISGCCVLIKAEM